MLQPCIICGNEFDNPANSKTCSPACRAELKLLRRSQRSPRQPRPPKPPVSWLTTYDTAPPPPPPPQQPRPPPERQCVICSKTFGSYSPRVKCCSNLCSRQYRRDQTRTPEAKARAAAYYLRPDVKQQAEERRRERERLQPKRMIPCVNCGKDFEPVFGRQLCSFACTEQREKERGVKRREAERIARINKRAAEGESQVAVCVVCTSQFCVADRPPGAKTCCYDCARAWETISNREKSRNRARKGKQLTKTGRHCENCGALFYPKISRQRFCSPGCCRRWHGPRRKKSYTPVPATISRVCTVCKTPFMTNRPAKLTCSGICGDTHAREATGVARARQKRRDRVLLRAVKELLAESKKQEDHHGA